MRILILSAAALLLASCGQKTPAPSAPSPADAVAMVGGTPVLQSDLDFALQDSGALPPAAVLQRLTEEESLARLAVAEGLDQEASVRAAVRRMLATRALEKHLVRREITDAEVTAALQATPAPPAQPRLRLSFLRYKAETAGSIDAAAAKLEEARTAWLALPEAERTKGFGGLAVQYSDDPDTRYQGGEAGWITSGERHVLLPPEATAAAAALNQTGLVPDVLRASDAAWLLLVTETGTQTRPGTTPEAVRARLQAGQESAARQSLLQRALQASPVRILKPQPQDPARQEQPAIPAGP